MGAVQKLIKGKDDAVRGAEVRICTKGKVETRRPLQKLVPLQLRERSEEDSNVGKDKECANEILSKERTPKRAAAKDARWKTRLVLDSCLVKGGECWFSQYSLKCAVIGSYCY